MDFCRWRHLNSQKPSSFGLSLRGGTLDLVGLLLLFYVLATSKVICLLDDQDQNLDKRFSRQVRVNTLSTSEHVPPLTPDSGLRVSVLLM